jgi:hypothetical protein
MEPYSKRQRLYAQLTREFPLSFEDEEGYYDETPNRELIDEETDLEEEEVESDPDATFTAERARLDHKLKSTFESIFEKYGKDFDGIGDEVDLATGKILVNNGHLLQMENERDAGDARGSRYLPKGYSVEVDLEEDDSPTSSMEDTESLEVEEEELEGLSDDDGAMVEDDMILRGFTQANRLVSPELGSFTDYPPRQQRPAVIPRFQNQSDVPTQSDILAQFGPQLGPKIVEYISQQEAQQEAAHNHDIESAWHVPALPDSNFARSYHESQIGSARQAPSSSRSRPVQDDSHIEPAWRAPPIPNQRPRKRPIIKSIIMPPEIERSPSPEAHGSVWGHGPAARYNVNPFRQHTSGLSNQNILSGPGVSKRARHKYTDDEDDILIRWAARAQEQGISASNKRLWQELEAKVRTVRKRF